MITERHETPILTADHSIVVVTQTRITRQTVKGTWLFAGEKQPIAIIIRGAGGEQIFDLDDRQIANTVPQIV